MGEKVLFLDIDGVLNSFSGLIKRGGQSLMDIYDEHEEVLLWFVRMTGVKIVLSSTWRYPFLKQGEFDETELNNMRYLFHYAEIRNAVIGATPRLNRGVRGGEIHRWVVEHLPSMEIDEFVIWDDDDDMEPYMDHLIQTDNNYGLTYVEAIRAAEKLFGEGWAKKNVWR